MTELREEPCGRPSMVRRVAQGANWWTSVDLLVCEVGHEGAAIRAALEEMGVKVNLFPIGQARHVVNVLSGEECTAPYVILDTHGDSNGQLDRDTRPARSGLRGPRAGSVA
ncbi:MAG TPA: hypothetical protein VG370_26380 [Chloroflexota bacterium]|jgi:hypothetical protein|nr:hypothetical protein [Chloroflexota bacterium]